MFSCFDPYRMQVHWFATVFTDQYSRSLLATGCMHHHDRGTIGSGIVVSPLAHCVDDRPEISPLIGPVSYTHLILTTVLSRITINWAMPKTAKIHHLRRWLRSSSVSASPFKTGGSSIFIAAIVISLDVLKRNGQFHLLLL